MGLRDIVKDYKPDLEVFYITHTNNSLVRNKETGLVKRKPVSVNPLSKATSQITPKSSSLKTK